MGYEQLEEISRTIKNLEESAELLHWDQQVMMPEDGIKARSQEQSVLTKIIHQKTVSNKLAEAIADTEEEKLDEEKSANLREVKREHERARKVPEELQEEISRKSSETVDRWEKARERSDFSAVKDDLQELVELKRQYAEEIDSDKEPYQVLFKDYEPYIEFERMEKILERIKNELTDIVEKIDEEGEDLEDVVFRGEFPEEEQEEIFREVVDAMGYDWNRGRLDISAHPFTMGNQFDCRITTRYDPENIEEGLMAAIHEAGHALYEQGLPQDLYGAPAGDSRDLSVHESQSRLWENNLARSRELWEFMLPKLKESFPDQFEDVSVEECYRSTNRIDPENLIRIKADELTYHLHIVIRFELERRLINGEIDVDELPELWNQKYEEYLGITPESDAEGVMQDVHWYQGSFGYFTTYSLGSVLAAQIRSTMDEELDVEQKIAEGDLEPLREWLRQKIHSRGSVYRTEELVEKVTGERPNADHFLEYIREKYGDLYNVEL
jgi:carboxypeptidase Taq